jgi:hypothetical protein
MVLMSQFLSPICALREVNRPSMVAVKTASPPQIATPLLTSSQQALLACSCPLWDQIALTAYLFWRREHARYSGLM